MKEALDRFTKAYKRLSSSDDKDTLIACKPLYKDLINNLKGGLREFLRPLTIEQELPVYELLIRFHAEIRNSCPDVIDDDIYIASIQRMYSSTLKRNLQFSKAREEGIIALKTFQNVMIAYIDVAKKYGVTLPKDIDQIILLLQKNSYDCWGIGKELSANSEWNVVANKIVELIQSIRIQLQTSKKDEDVIQESSWHAVSCNIFKLTSDLSELAALEFQYKEAAQYGECALAFAPLFDDLSKLGRYTLAELSANLAYLHFKDGNYNRAGKLNSRAVGEGKPSVYEDILGFYTLPKEAKETMSRKDPIIPVVTLNTIVLKHSTFKVLNTFSDALYNIELAQALMGTEIPDYQVIIAALSKVTSFLKAKHRETDEPEIVSHLAKAEHLIEQCHSTLDQLHPENVHADPIYSEPLNARDILQAQVVKDLKETLRKQKETIRKEHHYDTIDTLLPSDRAPYNHLSPATREPINATATYSNPQASGFSFTSSSTIRRSSTVFQSDSSHNDPGIFYDEPGKGLLFDASQKKQ